MIYFKDITDDCSTSLPIHINRHLSIHVNRNLWIHNKTIVNYCRYYKTLLSSVDIKLFRIHFSNMTIWL